MMTTAVCVRKWGNSSSVTSAPVLTISSVMILLSSGFQGWCLHFSLAFDMDELLNVYSPRIIPGRRNWR